MITHLHIPSVVGPSHNIAVLPVYTERQLITMFYKSVHHNEPQEGFDSWLSAVQNQLSIVEQLPSRDQSFYLEAHGAILQEFKTILQAITRFEHQFMMSCPCAVQGAGVLLSSLQKVSKRLQKVIV